MKRLFTVVAAIAVFFIGSTTFAEGFDWSQCWCNYGGGIEKGNIILNGGIGITEDMFEGDDHWGFPYIEFSAEYAMPVWKLPFTFGGYFAYDARGFDGRTTYVPWGWYGWYGWYWGHGYFVRESHWAEYRFHFGGEVKYHVMMPVDSLDLYAGLKIGSCYAIGHNTDNDFIFLELQPLLGASWYFTDSFGINLEMGLPVWQKIGVTFKL